MNINQSSITRLAVRFSALAALALTFAVAAVPSVANAQPVATNNANTTLHIRPAHVVPGAKVNFQATQDNVKQVAFTQDGTGWLVLHGDNGYSSKGLPTKMTDRLDKLNTDGNVIQWAAFAPDGGWIISYDTGFSTSGLPTDASAKLKDLNTNNSNVTWAAFTQDGGWIFIYDSYGYSSKGLSKGVVAELDKLNTAQTPIKTITFAPDGSWVIIDDDNGYAASKSVDTKITDKLAEINGAGTIIRQMEYTADGTGWIILSGDNDADGSGLPAALVTKMTELTPSTATTPTKSPSKPTPNSGNKPTPKPGKPTPAATKSFNSSN